MHNLEENDIYNFPIIWDSFLKFESISRGRGETLDAFIERWKENMGLAQCAGCDYTDTILACKLLQKANLNETDSKNIVNSIAIGKSEILCTLLCILEDYSVAKPGSQKEQENKHSKLVKEELSEEIIVTSQPSTLLKEEFLPEIKIEIKDDASEDQAVISSRLENEEDDDESTGGDFSKEEIGAKEEIGDGEDNILFKARNKHIVGERHHCTVCPKSFKEGSTLKHHIMREHTNDRPFKCPQCSFSAVKKSDLNRHIQSHSGERPFKCSLCEKSFPVRSTLKTHIKQVHTNERPFKCQHCDYRSLDNFNLNRHMRSHTGERPFKCSYCEKGYTEKKDLKRHIMRVHTDESPFQCPHCKYSTVYKNYLTIHIRSHTGERPFKCTVCEKAFTDKKNLDCHTMRAHTNERPFQCPQCSYSTVHKQSLTIHMRRHTREQPFKCSLCGRAFSDKFNMKRHMSTVHSEHDLKWDELSTFEHDDNGERMISEDNRNESSKEFNEDWQDPDQILQDGKIFSESSVNDSSKLQDENGPKNFPRQALKSQCELCGKTVTMKFMEKHHEQCLSRSEGIESDKQSEKKGHIERLQCEHCGKAFPTQRRLKEHYLRCPNLEQDQREAKGYACPANRRVTCKICNKTFARQHNYKNHLSLHSGERNFKCDICPATFTNSFYLDLHKIRHEKGKRYHCDICPKSFHGTTGLKRHIMRLHTNERPFQCPHCSYCTVDNTHLNRHIQSHTGERPFKCPLCKKAFAEKKNIKRHLKAVHAKDIKDGDLPLHELKASGDE